MGTDDSRSDTERTCGRCGGDALPSDGPGVPLLECVDCGNVLGIADSDDGATDTKPVDTDTVTATDGDLAQLRTLLRSNGAESIRAEELCIETTETTLSITATDGELRIRETDPE